MVTPRTQNDEILERLDRVEIAVGQRLEDRVEQLELAMGQVGNAMFGLSGRNGGLLSPMIAKLHRWEVRQQSQRFVARMGPGYSPSADTLHGQLVAAAKRPI